jgi:hypothetical protein
MTTRYQYKNRWEQLESEIKALQKQSDEEYKRLPAVSHESRAWQKAFDKYFAEILRPNKEKIEVKKKEAEYCRIRSLEQFYCNKHLYSDIQPYEVIEIVSDTWLKLRSMNYVQTDASVERLRESFTPGGFCGHFDNSVQEWICTPDPNGIVVEVRRRKDGHFYEVGGSIPYVISDQPRRYRDFNF